MKTYKLLKDRFEYKTGTIVLEFRACDYGLSSDDTYNTGIEHTTVSLDGDTPFFTIPLEDLEEII